MARRRVSIARGAAVALSLALAWAIASFQWEQTAVPSLAPHEERTAASTTPDQIGSHPLTNRVQIESRITLQVSCANSRSPVSGASVQIVPVAARFLAADDVMDLGITDAHGVFSCPLQEIDARIGSDVWSPADRHDLGLRVVADGFAPESLPIPQESMSLVVRIAPRAPMCVRFVDRAGGLVAHVRVLVSESPFEPMAPALRDREPAAGGSNAPRAIVGGRSDAEGRIRLDGLPEASVHVYCEHSDHVALDATWSGGGAR